MSDLVEPFYRCLGQGGLGTGHAINFFPYIAGYQYAAIRNGQYCFCGNFTLDGEEQVNQCNQPCKGNIMQSSCGGKEYLSLFEIGESFCSKPHIDT